MFDYFWNCPEYEYSVLFSISENNEIETRWYGPVDLSTEEWDDLHRKYRSERDAYYSKMSFRAYPRIIAGVRRTRIPEWNVRKQKPQADVVKRRIMHEKQLSPERIRVLEVLRDANRPMQTGRIAHAVGSKVAAVSQLLRRLLKDGRVVQTGYGKYRIT